MTDDTHRDPTPVGTAIAQHELRTLDRRLRRGLVHGDQVAEVLQKLRPADGVLRAALLCTISLVVAFLAGFVTIAVSQVHPAPATSTTQPSPQRPAPSQTADDRVRP
ncbi:hypothetical protein LLS1_24310 [Leifsonia sp. LS1]|uniref:hypothetical protein n=1 Tax=Leifsonia sp. LS1 TaxID=2828483 RepID=UPI001CFC587E|nr:hypothetical protein [Leifsonia sp. LS1]GIT80762.1 hypothetical protein LLS1_24310 [Leifsonia sp. LS1]